MRIISPSSHHHCRHRPAHHHVSIIGLVILILPASIITIITIIIIIITISSSSSSASASAIVVIVTMSMFVTESRNTLYAVVSGLGEILAAGRNWGTSYDWRARAEGGLSCIGYACPLQRQRRQLVRCGGNLLSRKSYI